MSGLTSRSVGFLICVLITSLLTGSSHAADTVEEKMSYLDNGSIRIGVNFNVGGAITYLSKSGGENNLINNYDWGRQIQMSHYSGPIPFTPNGKQPLKVWKGLGWNPIQSGDVFKNRSKIVEQRNDGQELYVKCIPMQWPLNNEPGECTFECWIQLKDNTAQVRCRTINSRADKTQYHGRHQELPAIYTNGPWYHLMTYTKDKPFTGDTLTQIPAKFPWDYWKATENWAALVNDDNWGLGIWEPDAVAFIGGFSGSPGKGGTKDAATGYIAPLQTEIFDHNIVYEFNYTLILGSLEEIRRFVYAHALHSAPPNYHFEKDRQHWYYNNTTDAGWPIQSALKVSLEGNNPYMVGPSGFWKAAEAPDLYIEAAFQSSQTRARVFWTRQDSPTFTAVMNTAFDIIPDGQFHVYTVKLSASPEYRGAITGLRFDPVPVGKAGEFVKIKSISSSPPN